MPTRFLEEKFRNLNEKIILDAFEICPYEKICPYKRSTGIKCFGCNEKRPWKFICDVKRLKGENNASV